MRETKSIFQRKHLQLLSEESLLEEGAWSGEQGGEEGVGWTESSINIYIL